MQLPKPPKNLDIRLIPFCEALADLLVADFERKDVEKNLINKRLRLDKAQNNA